MTVIATAIFYLREILQRIDKKFSRADKIAGFNKKI